MMEASYLGDEQIWTPSQCRNYQIQDFLWVGGMPIKKSFQKPIGMDHN